MVAAGATIIVVGLALVTVSTESGPSGDGEQFGDDVLGLVVATEAGNVLGVRDREIRSWRGIPYAAAPVGDLRWRPPQQPEPWDDVIGVSEYGDSCAQPDDYVYGAASLMMRPGSSEDCLYLNVNRPDDDRRDLPVMVWLHGGGFFSGNGSGAVVNSPTLVDRGVVVVTINYRLGRLGFFAHPALRQGVANLGLLDQMAALRWVRANIAEFGGNAGNVTLVGGSAGAMSVNALMASPQGVGLFDRAIAQSAPSDQRSQTLGQARRKGAEAYPGLSASELRALPPEALLSSTFNTLLGDAPIVDSVLPRTAADTFEAGDELPVPYLVGTTSEEFSNTDYEVLGRDAKGLRSAIGGRAHETVAAAYGPAFDRQVLDDLFFTMPALRRAHEHAERAPTFRYVFDVDRQGSRHGAEVSYVFDDPDSFVGDDARLRADEVADYWVAFATTGRPDVPGLPTWPEAVESGYLRFTPTGPVAQPVDAQLARLIALAVATD